ncbi:MAG: tetraacyldisaccharide 4'-kinase, partial [Phycisphaerae bacterium]
RRVLCFSGIGNPAAFERSVAELGATAADHLIFADHHDYDQADIERIIATARGYGVDMVVTTEKDAVKLSTVQAPAGLTFVAVVIEIDFMDDGGTILQRVLDDTLGGFGGA